MATRSFDATIIAASSTDDIYLLRTNAFAWDPDLTDSSITLSNGNRTATANQANALTAISGWTRATGKLYWEIYMGSGGSDVDYCSGGICDRSKTTDFDETDRVGWDESWAHYNQTAAGWKYHNSGFAGVWGSPWGQSETHMFAVDIDAGKLWHGVDGVWDESGDPGADTGEMFNDSTIIKKISACITPRSNGSDAVARFGSSQLSYSIPSGFEAPNMEPISFAADIAAASSSTGIQLKGGIVDESLTDQAGLDDTIAASGGSQTVNITDGAGLDDTIAAGGTFNTAQIDIAGLGDWINGGLETNHALSDGAGLDDAIEALNWSEFLRENQFNFIIRYFMTLTGTIDDTTDLEIEIKQFQARKRDGEQTYLSVTIPGFDYAEQVADRANGQLIIEMAYFIGADEQLSEEILRVDLENIRTDQGPKNRAITLTGHRAESYGQQIATLTDPTYKYVSGGIRRYRFAIPDPYLNPGDTAIVGDDEFRVGYITYAVSDRYRSMEITEAS